MKFENFVREEVSN